MRRSSPVLFLALALAACAAPQPPRQTAAPAPAPAGPAASCVDIIRIREARVIDDRTIDFHMNDGRVLRSNLPNSCPSLGFEKAFTYSTSLSKLCSTDIITVIHQGGGPRTGASCGLGQFTPVPPAPAAR